MPHRLANIKVASLIKNGEREWDEEILNDICNERDRLLITKIALPRRDKEDSWYWAFDKKGEFTVKSCYNRIRGERSMLNVSFWRKLWSLKLQVKSSTIYGVCRLCLPTAVDLRNKHVNVETVCSWCHNHEENGIHVLFDCVFARAVWEAIGLSDLIQFKPDENVFDIFLRTFTRCNSDKDVGGLEECPAGGEVRVWVVRCGKNQSWVKINTDAVVIPGTHQIGTGTVIRDEDGRFLHARCMDIAGEWNVKEAEARSLRDAVGWTVAMGFKKCIFELDSKIVLDACNGGSGRSIFYSIIAECVEGFKHLKVQFTYK
ncbi:uncharacterized protein LOC141720155 [Apium graveolens]|uniref:uncharacterized protein LOC141720155 n=1 Tax=Apium graveolens TaxID=4045 RepID=UPI003D7950B2